MKPGRLMAFKWVDGGVCLAPIAPESEASLARDPRQRLKEIAADRGVSLALLFHVIGKNTAYVQQYVERGTPKRLPEDARRHLAIYLNVDERELGARAPWTPITHASDGTGADTHARNRPRILYKSSAANLRKSRSSGAS